MARDADAILTIGLEIAPGEIGRILNQMRAEFGRVVLPITAKNIAIDDSVGQKLRDSMASAIARGTSGAVRDAISKDMKSAVDEIDSSSKKVATKLKDSVGSVLRTYQVAAQFYQAGHIASSLGLPGQQQLSMIGSSIQTFAPLLSASMGAGAIPMAGAIGVGIAAVGGVKKTIEEAVKAYAPLETEYMKIRVLAGTSDADISSLIGKVRDLSIQTGITQENLVKALYFISSSGYQGADAFNVLAASAKSSASGLGDVITISDVATSVMNAYGIAGKDAFDVTDKLIVAVREGKAEPEQFARSLGQVLPIAREAGITLDELLASISSITLQGFTAPQAITSIKQAISNLVSPSAEARSQLDLIYGYGKGADTVREMLKTQGFQYTLQEMYNKSGGNLAALDTIFGNIRGLVGVLALANGEFEKMDAITAKMGQSFGATEDSITRTRTTFNSNVQQMERAWDSMKISLGESIAPLVIPVFVDLKTIFTGLGVAGSSEESAFGKQLDASRAVAKMVGGIYDITFVGILSSLITRKSNKDTAQKSIDEINALSIAANTPVNKEIESAIWTYPSDSLLGLIQRIEANLPEARAAVANRTGTINRSVDWSAAYGDMPGYIPTPGEIDWSAAYGETASNINKMPSVSEVGDYIKYAKAAYAAKQSADETMVKMQQGIATAVSRNIDSLIAAGKNTDQFLDQLGEINKKLADTSKFGAVAYENGKPITAAKMASEDARLEALKAQVEIDKLSDKIRATRKPSKDPLINQRAALTDQKADMQLANKMAEIADLEAAIKSRGSLTSENQEYKDLLEARRALIQKYNEGTFGTVKGVFDDILKKSAGTEAFNALLAEGGDLLAKFAENAGLMRTTGFTTEIMNAALQMKYLYDATGKLLKGDDLVKGFAEYSRVFSDIRGKLIDLQPYLSGTEKMTKEVAIKIGLVSDKVADSRRVTPTIASWDASQAKINPARTPTTASWDASQAASNEQRDIAEMLNSPEGIMKLFMKQNGLSYEGGMKDVYNLTIKAQAPDIEKDVMDISAKLEEVTKNLDLAIPIGIRLARAKADPSAVSGGDVKTEDILRDLFGDILPKDGQTSGAIAAQVPIQPYMDLLTDGMDVSKLNSGIKDGLDKVKAEWAANKDIVIGTNISTVVDVSTAMVVGIDALRAYVQGAIQAGLDGIGFPTGQGTASPPASEQKASGGFVQGFGLVKVGELGPEMLVLPRGTGVIPANITSAINGVMPKMSPEHAPRPANIAVMHQSVSDVRTINVDARYSTEPKRTREAVVKGLTAQGMERWTRRRQQEKGHYA